MTPRPSNDIRIILSFAREEAIRLGSLTIRTDHIFLGLLRHRRCEAVAVLNALGVQLQEIKRSIETLIAAPQPIPFGQSSQVALSVEGRDLVSKEVSRLVPDGETPDSTHLLLAIMTSTDGVSHQVLSDAGIRVQDVMDHISHGAQADGASGRRQEGELLSRFGYDLVNAAVSGKLMPVIGRDREILRLEQILCRQKKNNPLLVGSSGSGKSAVVEGLALRIAARTVARPLLDKRIVLLDLGTVVAGTKFRGQFEERLNGIIKEVRESGNTILFIDEIHSLVGAGGGQGSMDASSLLKPALARGELQCIGATTFDEYRSIFSRDTALDRRFQKITVEPTTFAQTLHILEGVRPHYANYHGVEYTDEALKACITLSDRYIHDRCQPDKAIDILDEAGAAARIRVGLPSAELSAEEEEIAAIRQAKRQAAKDGDFQQAAELRRAEIGLMKEMQIRAEEADAREDVKVVVSETDIADAVATVTGIPVSRVAAGEAERLMGIEATLSASVIGQDEAIREVARAIRRNRSGLRNPGKPVGTFLFLGPTGVGKTYLTKKIAEYMFGSAEDIIRIDMSEYSEKFTASRLIGAPPGYVGYNEGGQLSEAVRRKPYSVVLLDEIEKASPDIYNLLLQVLDEGRLTDSTGRQVDFRNCIIVMTSNVGSRELKDYGDGIGYARSRDDRGRTSRNIINKALDKRFPPEFLNRLDAQVYFNQLSREDMLRILDIELRGLQQRVTDEGFTLEVSEAARDFIADTGFDPLYGARPLKRAIQQYIEDPLAETILSGAPQGSTLRLDLSSATNDTLVTIR